MYIADRMLQYLSEQASPRVEISFEQAAELFEVLSTSEVPPIRVFDTFQIWVCRKK